MAASAGTHARTLSSVSQIRAEPNDFGAGLEALLRVPDHSSTPETLAWAGSVFKREVDAKQKHDLDLHSLLKRGPRHLDARRVRAARLNARKLASRVARLEELRDLAASWASPSDHRILVWTSLVGVKNAPVEPSFRLVVRSTYEALEAAVSAAWASAYELSLLEELAQHAVRRFSVATVLSLLPTSPEWGELFLTASSEATGEKPTTVLAVRDEGGNVAWFDLASDARAKTEPNPRHLVQKTASGLMGELPSGGWHAEFCRASDTICLTSVSRAPSLGQSARWLGWDGEFGAASTHFGRSLLFHFERHVARPFLEELGVRLKRHEPWLATNQGRPYLNLALLGPLTSALDASPALLTALAGGPLEPASTEREQRFRAPRLLAELALLDSRLRGRVREFQAEALRHARWFEELDLAILPDDALPTTLFETREFMDKAGGLYLETELALVRALSGLADLGSEGEGLDLRHLFPTLIADEDLASVAHCEDFAAALHAVHSDASALRALRAGVRSVDELPEGRAQRELSYFNRQHGFWVAVGAILGHPAVEGDDRALLEALLRVCPVPQRERARRKRATLAFRQQATKRLAVNNGWLGRQALSQMFERINSFSRLHEALRVALVRSYSLLRHAILDVGRRLARLNPKLDPDSVWHLSFDELVSAVHNADADLESLVDERVRCHRQRLERPAPGRRLHDLSGLPNPPSLGTRIVGAPTATGRFMGRVRRLRGLTPERPLTPADVLVAHSFDAERSLFIGHAGAIVSAVGGPMSHAAFAARQLGVPALVGAAESLDTLREGDEVLVDGNDGVLVRTKGEPGRH